MTEFRDPDTFEPADGPQSWRCDPGFLIQLVDTLLAARKPQDIEILSAYYARIREGRWPEPGHNEPYHPAGFWARQLLPPWTSHSSHKGKVPDDIKKMMKHYRERKIAIELDLIRQIMEAYFQARRSVDTPIPSRSPDAGAVFEARVAAALRTR